MKFGDSVGIKAPQWTANEQVVNTDINFISASAYQNFIDALVSLMMPSGLSASFPDIILGDGVRLEWTAGMTATLHPGMAFSFTGSYVLDGVWGFTADPGSVFGAIVPVGAPVAVSVGDTSDRYDTIEIRPVRTDYDSKTRWFQDPVTEAQTQASVPTRVNFGYEFQILEGTPGLGVAPTHTAGWIKIAEVFVPANATALAQVNFLPCEETNTAWTAEKTVSQRRAVLLFAHDHIGGDGAPITEGALSLSDVTTADVGITMHGLVPKAPNDTQKFLRGDGAWANPVMPHFSGLRMTCTSTTITVAAGQCSDSTNALSLVLSAVRTKSLATPFSSTPGGNGSFVTVIEQWMHVFIIRRDSDGYVDIGFDTSLTAANRPSGWTYYRRIGSFYVTSGLIILEFVQAGNQFWFKSPPLDIANASVSTTASLHTLTVPLGLKCVATCILWSSGTVGEPIYYLSSPDCDDLAPTTSDAAPLATFRDENDMQPCIILTDVNSQIRVRAGSSCHLDLVTNAYTDLELFN